MSCSKHLRTWVMAGAAALSLVAGTRAIDVQAQSTATSKPRQFEVASVKPTLSPAELGAQAGRLAAQGGAPQPAAPVFFGIRTTGSRFSASTVTLRGLIARAYGVKAYQIQGGPPWAASDYFTIEARASGDATNDEFNEMLKALLADRFGLRARQETQPGKVYALTLARPDRRLGSGLKRTSGQCVAQIEERKRNPPAPGTSSTAAARFSPTDPAECGSYRIMGTANSTTITFSGQPMSTLVDHISSELAAPVVDRTGLDGLFDILAEYESQRRVAFGGPSGLDPNSTESPKLPLPNALERQLGIKLEMSTGEIPMIVIEAAEKPLPD